jgi:xylulokinase
MILCVDVGTTRIKAALYSPSGKRVAFASRALELLPSADPRIHEVAPEAWISALASCSRELLASGRAPDRVVVSGNGPTLLPVDSGGRPLHPAISWMDARSLEESALLKGMLGRYNNTAFYLPKAYWFYRNRRPAYEAAAHFLSCPEYVEYFLTGEPRTYLPARGYEDLIWNEERLTGLGMDPRKFPPFAAPGAPVGRVSGRASEATGIQAGAIVYAGAPDFISAIVGTASTRPGRACDRAGSSEGLNLCSERGTGDGRLIDMPHVVEPYRNVSGVVSTSGRAVEWFLEAGGRPGAFDEFFAEAAEAEPGARGLIFLPYLAGERTPFWDPKARGAFIGLTLAHGNGELERAVVEGTAFALRHVAEAMAQAGAPVTELRVAGAAGKNAALCAIKADVLGLPVLAPRDPEAELLGDACIALAALGEHSSVAEAAEALVGFDAAFEPDQARKRLYDELFEVYKKGYETLSGIFHDLDAIASRR